MLFSFYGYNPPEDDILGIGEGLDLQLQNVSTLSTKIYCPIGRKMNFEVDYGKKVRIPIHVNFLKEGNVEEAVYPIIHKNVNPITGDFQVNITSGRFITNGVVGDFFTGERFVQIHWRFFRILIWLQIMWPLPMDFVMLLLGKFRLTAGSQQ